MPQEYERFGRNSFDWTGSQLSRSQQRDAAAHDDPAKPTIPSKLKKGKCKGADGWHADHDFVFMRERDNAGREVTQPCDWKAGGKWDTSSHWYKYVPVWSCNHEERCARCGHLERASYQLRKSVDCPEYAGQPVPNDVIRDCDYKQAESDRRREAWMARRVAKKTVKGPQSYRKPKQQKE